MSKTNCSFSFCISKWVTPNMAKSSCHFFQRVIGHMSRDSEDLRYGTQDSWDVCPNSPKSGKSISLFSCFSPKYVSEKVPETRLGSVRLTWDLDIACIWGRGSICTPLSGPTIAKKQPKSVFSAKYDVFINDIWVTLVLCNFRRRGAKFWHDRICCWEKDVIFVLQNLYHYAKILLRDD